MAKYIWQQSGWPRFTWQADELATALSDASFRLGTFLGKLASIGFELQNRAGFESLSDEIVNSAAIEGEALNRADVRSSVARRMDIALVDKGVESHSLDARVEMMLDATRGWNRPMTLERLKSYHAALFPTGYSGLSRIRVGELRDDTEGPMQVVSRHGSMIRVHFEAPPVTILTEEVNRFLDWANGGTGLPGLVKVAFAHLHFLALHPFEDGNGRLARALTEWLMARNEQSALRFYSLSAQIQKEKEDYYTEIEHAQRNSLDVTRWVKWFVGCHSRAVSAAESKFESILGKARFWQRCQDMCFNVHQRDMLNRLLDGFEGNLTSSKWAKICKVSQDTAGREISALVEMGVLVQKGAGRSTHYEVVGGNH